MGIRVRRFGVPIALCLLHSAAASAAEAEPAITGGTEVATCGWAGVVQIVTSGGFCTGNLIAPDIVVFAAHCSDAQEIRFGELRDEAALSVDPSRCERHPDWTGIATQGADFAFCVLSEAVDVPVVPLAQGCELEGVQAGAPIVAVGFGLDAQEVGGIKRELQTEVMSIERVDFGERAKIGREGQSTCSGDSGGPYFLELPDGTWRQVAVHSTGVKEEGEPCGAGGYGGIIDSGVIAWIESASGVDVTPCFDAVRTWQPGPGCAGFPIAPGSERGAWSSGCSKGMLGGPSETCGPNGSDGLPPQLNIVEPADGQTYEVDGGMAEIAIALEPIDDLSGVAMVQVWIGEGSPGPSMQPPFVWSATLGEGEHAIDFVAVDAFGNEAKERRTVIVGESSDTSGSDGGDDDPHDDAHDDATAGAPTAPSRAGGCRVPGDRSGTGALWLIALLSGIRRRRLAQRTGQ